MGGRADVTVDVAIVGGGIAGAALATVLARDGYTVLLLERQTSYRDKVRGEVLVCWAGGMLGGRDSTAGLADQMSAGATEGDLLLHPRLPRAHGRVQALILLHDLAQRGRFAGPDRESARFLDAFRFRCLPDADIFRAARPAGPCAFYPMNDTWTDSPCAPGVVLLGDAAGWNDPIIGQGLSIALRDVRMVADVVRAGPDLGGPRMAAQLGPENVPAEAFGPENIAGILAMG